MKALLFDMDGVVYNSETLIPGAPETLAWVRERGIPYMFVTNTTSRGRGVLVEKLAKFGIAATEDEILTPCVAAKAYMEGRDRDGAVALFVRKKTYDEFEGLRILESDRETGARFVVVGDMEEEWNFKTLTRAFRLLHSSPDSELIALGMTRFWQAEDGLRLDTAPFVAALECASGRRPVVLGKPAAAFFHAAAERLGVDTGEILMIGDDVRVDVGGAQQAGLKGALVKTGKYRAGDEKVGPPEYVIDSIADLVRLLR